MRSVDLVEGIDVKAQMVSGCPHCKARLAPGAKFCAGCGKPVVAGATAQKKFCSGCGGQLAGGAKFCSGCGTNAEG